MPEENHTEWDGVVQSPDASECRIEHADGDVDVYTSSGMQSMSLGFAKYLYRFNRRGVKSGAFVGAYVREEW